MARRFERLRQGNMTIHKYYMKFMQLARFVVNNNMNEMYLMVKFKANLRRRIKKQIDT